MSTNRHIYLMYLPFHFISNTINFCQYFTSIVCFPSDLYQSIYIVGIIIGVVAAVVAAIVLVIVISVIVLKYMSRDKVQII